MEDAKAPRRFLLFMGDNYYPSGGWRDLHGTYHTEAEARAAIRSAYSGHDWYQLIDLRTGKEIK